MISIHALLAESDPKQSLLMLCFYLFLSTLSLRRATGQNLINGIRLIISIHALLAESDCQGLSEKLGTVAISIHALLAESDELASHSRR